MLAIENLQVSYSTKQNSVEALGPLGFHIDQGEIYAIIGPSGCGKSTLLHVLSGIHKDFHGKVTLDGQTINPKQVDIGFIPQHFGLLAWKNVKENCLLSLQIKKKEITAEIEKRISYVIKRLDLEPLMERYPNELSGGQKQRVAIARAFIMNPKVLLMDEPFSALDSLTREEAQELFVDIWNQYKVTTLFVTHSIEEAIYMGKKIILMSQCPGKIIEIMDNPLFNQEKLREKREFLELSTQLRKVIQKGWKQ